MTQEALKLALVALENMSTALREDDVLGSDIELMLNSITAVKEALAQPVQEPEYWNVIDPAGNVVASETDAIRGWACIAGSYKPTVEGLLGFHDQGWRVLPKATPPAAQRPWVGLTDEEMQALWDRYAHMEMMRAIEAKLKEKNT